MKTVGDSRDVARAAVMLADRVTQAAAAISSATAGISHRRRMSLTSRMVGMYARHTRRMPEREKSHAAARSSCGTGESHV